MFGIINALGALQDNCLKYTALSEFHLRARTPSRSTERVPTNLLPTFLDGIHRLHIKVKIEIEIS